ncbi:MAG: alpha/beta hydrolase [Proteobacteria bacterium]|nr:alpha/beta hydrolase [Pseudomonadota bacterium]
MLNTHHKNSHGRLVDTFSGIVQIPVDSMHLEAEWIMPPNASGVVIFAHGSGSSRHSRRNQFVASILHESGVGTVLLDLLTRQEERRDAADGQLRFDIEMLTNRLITAVRWVEDHPAAHEQPIGLFGASTGAAAAIAAASILGDRISAVVSRGGRPDLAYEHLRHVTAPTLLIVGESDDAVVRLNKEASQHLRCLKKLSIIPGATHLFEEPGALERVASLAAAWFQKHLAQDFRKQETHREVVEV